MVKSNETHEPIKDEEHNIDVSIIIVNWNTDKLLQQCLTSIIKNTKNVKYEVMIVDNNSKGNGFKVVQQQFSGYKNFFWFENDKNIGGLADNQVLPYCKGRYLLQLGPDTIITDQAIEKMVNFLDENEKVGAVAAKLINPDGSPQNYYYKFWSLSMVFFSCGIGKFIDRIFFKNRFERYYFGKDIDTSKVTIIEQPAMACLMFRRKPFAVNYIIDEDFPFYFNDVDLCKRIYDSGYKIFLLPSAQVIHFQSSSFKKANSEWKAQESRKSLIKYFEKYHRNKTKLLKLILAVNDSARFIYKRLFRK